MSPRRVTITDIARHAEVSTAAVSYALNNQAGVSADTRERILLIADRLGWRPNSAARTLHSARTNALGLVLFGSERPHGDGAEFFVEFLAGVQEELSDRDVLLVLHTVPDADAANEAYRRWMAEHRVDGVILLNPLTDDPRVPVLEELELPAVVIGDLRDISTIPSLWTDDVHATKLAVDHLVQRGHTRIARLGVKQRYRHSAVRQAAFVAAMRRNGLSAKFSDYTGGAPDHEVVLGMLAQDHPPTAILFEDSSVAARVSATLQRLGVTIPDQLAVVAWDDSGACTLVNPTLTALRRDIRRYGHLAAEHLLRAVAGEELEHVQATVTELVVREST